ncbi:MAG: TonB-dependent receptor [Gammaproteobacteria bacterium]|nr:TonB-dependent receptor [Gammaproteobacteria bacterium]MYF67637.1 TonB-dependent receptor [Gammaproteobacteria bacterium]MYK36200.1 TonB-dependent receptor [Gammaproteobacteria bacterium]
MKSRNLLASSIMALMALPVAQSVSAQELSLEEIVVTARKREENIYEIPISVSAFSQDQLDQAGIGDFHELSKFIPGLDFHGVTATAGRVNPQIRVRGMNQQIITPSTQVGALFWDGSYIAAGGGFLPITDVERVEVIKGPQTAYFGRNTFSGAINYIPRLPGDEWEADLTLQYSPSQHDEYIVGIGIGGPISDRVGLRLYAGYEQNAGDFNFQDGTPFGVQKDLTFNGTLTIDVTEDFRVKLTGYYVDAEDGGVNGGVDSRLHGTPTSECNRTYTGEYLNPATGQRTPFTRNISTDFTGSHLWCGDYPDGENLVFGATRTPEGYFPGGQIFLGRSLTELHPLLREFDILKNPPGKLGGFNRTYRVQLSGEYDVADHTLSFQASRADTGTLNYVDFWYGVATIPGTVFALGNNIATQETYYEARIASPQDRRLRYLVGVSDYDQRYRLGNVPTLTQLDPATTTATVDFQDNGTTALFASVDYDLTEDLTVSVEARYTDEQSVAVLEGNPSGQCGGFSPVCNETNEYTDFIPRVIFSYQPFEGATTYFSYSYSSLLGVATQAGFINSVAPEIIPDDQLEALGLHTPPQENTQYEIGWKQQTENWAFTAAVFYIDWKNQPFASVILLPTGGTSSYRGPGNSEYTGIDLEAQGNLTDWLSIRGTLTYVDAIMASFSSRGSNEFAVLGSGTLSVVNDDNEARNTPKWTASLSPTMIGNFAGREFYFRTDFFYESPKWADYSEWNRTKSLFRINARVGFDLMDNTTVEVFGTNLTDNKVLPNTNGTTTGPGGSRKAFTAGYPKREFGVRVRASF